MTDLQQRDARVSRQQIAANLRLWIADLRANPDKQGQFTMKEGEAYCCLGRAAVTMGLEVDETSGKTPYPAVRRGMGLTFEEEHRCIDMNDTLMKSFPEIADYIESAILSRYAESAE